MKDYKGEDFNKLVNNKKLVLVGFFASWCGPCQMIKPQVLEVSKELEYLDVYSVDIDKFRGQAILNSVQGVPTLILFKDGKEVSRSVGFKPKDKLISWIKENK